MRGPALCEGAAPYARRHKYKKWRTGERLFGGTESVSTCRPRQQATHGGVNVENSWATLPLRRAVGVTT